MSRRVRVLRTTDPRELQMGAPNCAAIGAISRSISSWAHGCIIVRLYHRSFPLIQRQLTLPCRGHDIGMAASAATFLCILVSADISLRNDLRDLGALGAVDRALSNVQRHAKLDLDTHAEDSLHALRRFADALRAHPIPTLIDDSSPPQDFTVTARASGLIRAWKEAWMEHLSSLIVSIKYATLSLVLPIPCTDGFPAPV
jgi:hypothetical protein